MTDWYWPKVLKHLTVQSLVFSGSFTVERIETVAVHSTIDTERIGDSRRTCSNDEHVAGTTAWFESRDLEGSQVKILQFRQAGSPGWRRLRLRLDLQFRQRFPKRTHDQVKDNVWSTSKALGNLQRSNDNLRNSLSGSGRPRGL